MFRRTDDRHARLQALRGAGRRLGRHHRRAHGLRARRQADRHSRQSSWPCAASRSMVKNPTPEEQRLSRRAQPLAQGGDRLRVDPRHAAANPELRPDRFSGGARGVDRREIPRLVRLRRRCRERLHPRPDARQHQLLLVHRRDRLVILSLLFPRSSALDDPGRRRRHGADGLRRIPKARCCTLRARWPSRCSPTSAAGRSCRRAAISPRWSSQRRSRRTCAPSIARCEAKARRRPARRGAWRYARASRRRPRRCARR